MVSIVTPNSQAVQIQRQLEVQARQLGSPPPPPMQLLVSPFAAPAEVLGNIVPQLNAMSRRGGGPGIALERLIGQQPARATLPNGRASLLSYTMMKETRGGRGPTRYRALSQVEVAPLAADSFCLYAVGMSAPDAVFEHDLPAMYAMLGSFRTNDQQIAAVTRQNIDASNQRFATIQQAHRDQMASFDSYNKAWERRSTETSKSNADFDEVIRGYRTVQDTTTGEKTQVDLGNVDKIVDEMNRGEPGRYKQIPLEG